MENENTVRQLKHIKIWIAIGSLGFVLIGLAALLLSLASVAAFAAIEDEISNDVECGQTTSFKNQASDFFEEGKLDELIKLIESRELTHPNDAYIYLYRARLHIVRNEWNSALEALDQTTLLSPSWEAEYIKPMVTVINRKQGESN
ncbi:MAG: hypothetical protein AB2809_01535 [Candidatus Thiodiazotropha sp.]